MARLSINSSVRHVTGRRSRAPRRRPALAGPAFFGSWNEAPLGDFFERIRISMPQDKPGSLSRQQTADIVAYILSFNKAPAGQTDLPGDTELLKAIKIVSAK